MTDVSTVRLYLMRALYLLIAVGLGSMIWPKILAHGKWGHMHGVAMGLFAALSALAILGVRYPLQMLPLLLFEVVWKSIWLLAVALPLRLNNQMDAETTSSVFDCVVGVVLCLIAIPWPFIWANYVKKRGDRWRPADARNVPPRSTSVSWPPGGASTNMARRPTDG